jgi:hypothetical protein
MQPVAVQDERPREGLFDEAANTENFRASWQVAREGGADWVLLPTWNDYAEGTAIAPSVKHGRVFLDLVAYYAQWFKTGQAPSIVRDAVYVTHRTQLADALPQYPETTLMTVRGGTPARDTVESLSFLTAPATVAVSVGGVTTTCAAPAGVASCLAPLRPGVVSVSVTRSGAPVTSVTSQYLVDASPYVQDLQYVGVSSLRTGTTAAPPTAPATSTAPAVVFPSAPAPAVPAPTTPVPATSTAPAVVAPTTPVAAPSTAPSGQTSTAPAPTASTVPAVSVAVPSPATLPALPVGTPTTGVPAVGGAVATTVGMEALSSSLTPGSVAWFNVTLSPSGAAGLLHLLVDGRDGGGAWTAGASAYKLGTGTLTSGTHTVVAVFVPSNASLFAGSATSSVVVHVP